MRNQRLSSIRQYAFTEAEQDTDKKIISIFHRVGLDGSRIREFYYWRARRHVYERPNRYCTSVPSLRTVAPTATQIRRAVKIELIDGANIPMQPSSQIAILVKLKCC